MLDAPVPRQRLDGEFADLGKVSKVVDYACREAETRGFRCFKYKSAGMSVAWDVAIMRALRDALPPETRLRFDPNAAYPPARAVAICRRLEELALEFYEDPADGLDGLAAVRARMRTPVATNMAVVQPDHLAPAIRSRAVDLILADIFMWGGIGPYRGMAAVAGTFGLEIAVHSLFETGLGAALNLHLSAALPQIRRATDSGLHVLHHQAVRDAVTDEPLTVRDGAMDVPVGLGLGVVLDQDAVACYNIGRATISR
jgi:glucarate dehydratase